MQPLIIDEVIEQCDSKVHDGCFVSIEIEDYSYNYTLNQDVTLMGKGVSLILEKGCATYDAFFTEQNRTFGTSVIGFAGKKYVIGSKNKTENFSVYKHPKNLIKFDCILTAF